METIKRYGMKMGDLGKDASVMKTTVAGRGVPEKYLETPSRAWLKRMIDVAGYIWNIFKWNLCAGNWFFFVKRARIYFFRVLFLF